MFKLAEAYIKIQKITEGKQNMLRAPRNLTDQLSKRAKPVIAWIELKKPGKK